jgi:hypothetical protein
VTARAKWKERSLNNGASCCAVVLVKEVTWMLVYLHVHWYCV